MKRASLLAGFAFLVFAVLSQIGTQAMNNTFFERFSAADTKQDGPTGTYNFDKNHSFISFRVRHMGLSEVPGFFRDFKGSVSYNAEDVTKSSVEFTAQAKSIDTGVAPRDNHLRTADFFDVEKYPEIAFKSTKVEKKGKNLLVTGDFTMKGVTKSLTIPFQIAGWLPADDHSGGKMGIAAETTVNRRDYGVNWGTNLPSGIPVVSDDVKIVLQIEAGKAKEAAPKTN
jgi:polyisoprenoid-binding protein YceI